MSDPIPSFSRELYLGTCSSFAGVTTVQGLSRVKTEFMNNGTMPPWKTLHHGYKPLVMSAVPSISSAFGMNMVYSKMYQEIKGEELNPIDRTLIGVASAITTSPLATFFELVMTDEQINKRSTREAFVRVLGDASMLKKFPAGVHIGIREGLVTGSLLGGTTPFQNFVNSKVPEEVLKSHEQGINFFTSFTLGGIVGVASVINDIAKTRIQTAALKNEAIPSGSQAVREFVAQEGYAGIAKAGGIRFAFIGLFLATADWTKKYLS